VKLYNEKWPSAVTTALDEGVNMSQSPLIKHCSLCATPAKCHLRANALRVPYSNRKWLLFTHWAWKRFILVFTFFSCLEMYATRVSILQSDLRAFIHLFVDCHQVPCKRPRSPQGLFGVCGDRQGECRLLKPSQLPACGLREGHRQPESL
jgi:hypothetical protein